MGGSREATDGVVGRLAAHAKENHPGGSAATPPKEGNWGGGGVVCWGLSAPSATVGDAFNVVAGNS